MNDGGKKCPIKIPNVEVPCHDKDIIDIDLSILKIL